MFSIFKKKSSLINVLPKVRGKYSYNVRLAKHTWFGVGGPAEVLFEPVDTDDLCSFFMNKPANVPVFLIGGGSNLLVRDGGIMGVVIKLSSSFFKSVEVKDDCIILGAGLQNAKLKKLLIDNEIGGLEFLCSIPGVIGGSVRTNAGCFGGCVADFIIAAEIVDGSGKKSNITLNDLKLGYRSSMFPEDWVICSITFRREHKNKEEIEKIIKEHRAYRDKKQPHNQRTAGSTFKNPQGASAWELIKKAGCDKLSVGGAKVSDMHCNFLINTGSASANDIEKLGDEIVRKVKKSSGITLEWEVKKVGVKK